MPERHRFMKGIFAWPGFKSRRSSSRPTCAPTRPGRAGAFFKLWRFALDGLFSFSTAPLKIWTYVGAISAVGAFIYLLITLIQKIVFGIDAPGYASILILLLFFNGLHMISNGIQGEYIARIFEEVKGRPLYVVGQTFGLDDDAAQVEPVVAAAGKPGTHPPPREPPPREPPPAKPAMRVQ